MQPVAPAFGGVPDRSLLPSSVSLTPRLVRASCRPFHIDSPDPEIPIEVNNSVHRCQHSKS